MKSGFSSSNDCGSVRIRTPGLSLNSLSTRVPEPALLILPETSVADPDLGSGAFLTPGSQTHTFESLVTIFWAKRSTIH